MADRRTLFGAPEAGGFRFGSEGEWSVRAGSTWQVTDRPAASVDRWHMEVDHHEGGVVFDLRQSGPVLGATFRF